MSVRETIDTVSFAVTAGGVLLGVVGLGQARQARMREFESFYTKRYWQLFDGLSRGAREAGDATTLTEADKDTMHAYLHLCEDEVDLRSQGWITTVTWQFWSRGIRFQTQRPAYVERMQTVPDELPQLRRFIDRDFSDPKDWPESRDDRPFGFWRRP